MLKVAMKLLCMLLDDILASKGGIRCGIGRWSKDN